jgi:hypothetical protein
MKNGYVDFSGRVHFKDASGRKHSHQFILSTSTFKDSLTHDEEGREARGTSEPIMQKRRELKDCGGQLGRSSLARGSAGNPAQNFAQNLATCGSDGDGVHQRL